MTLDVVALTVWRSWGGSLLGRAHERSGRGSQDAWSLLGDGEARIGVVADGCSAGARSEVGAGLGARFAAASCARRARQAPLPELPALVLADVVEELRRLACVCAVSGDDAIAFVEEHLLFTLLVCVARGDDALVFGVGDGLVCVDGALRVVEQGDAPDYPAYALFPEMPQPRVLVHHLGPARSIAIATDGAKELDDLPSLVDEPALERSPSLLQKRLRARERRPCDDCTVVVLRRASCA